MRPATTAVQNFLAIWGPTIQARLADLYTFTLQGGEVLRYTGFQIGISAPPPDAGNPVNFFPAGPKFDRTHTRTQVGIEIDEIEISLYAGPADLLGFPGSGTLSWQTALWAGLFDGATMALDRAIISGYLPDGITLNVIGTYNWFTGRIGDVEIGRSKTIIRVKSLLDLLTIQMPRRLYQASCNHVFGGAMCGYDRVNGINGDGEATGLGATTISAQPGSSQNSIFTTLAPNPSNLYDQGSIVGASGQNAGYTRSIGVLSRGVVYYLKPWIFPVAIGDQFQLLPGCPHTVGGCQQFNNLDHYGGFPYIPPPETAI